MIKVKKIKPMFTALITTMDKYTQDVMSNSGLISSKQQQGSLKEYQTVVAVGDSVRNVKVGDMVSINPTRFKVPKHKEGSLKDGVIQDNVSMTYNFDTVEMNGATYLLLQDRDIEFIIEEYEDIPDPTPSNIIQPDKTLIL